MLAFSFTPWGPSWKWWYGSWIYNYICHQCPLPLMLWVRIPFGARYTILCDTVCQCFVAGRWLSPGTPVSPTNKTDSHDITKILLKVALNTIDITKQFIYALDICWTDLYGFVVFSIITVKYFKSIFHILLFGICIFRT